MTRVLNRPGIKCPYPIVVSSVAALNRHHVMSAIDTMDGPSAQHVSAMDVGAGGKAEHMAAPTNAAYVKKVLANLEPSTHGRMKSAPYEIRPPAVAKRRALHASRPWQPCKAGAPCEVDQQSLRQGRDHRRGRNTGGGEQRGHPMIADVEGVKGFDAAKKQAWSV